MATTARHVIQADLDVRPEWYGALADGTTDDTAAFVAAQASGKNIRCTRGKTYILKNFVLTTTLDLNGAELRPAVGADWVVKVAAQDAHLVNGNVNDPSLRTLYATTTTASIASGLSGTPITFPVASTAKIAAGKLVAITQTNGSHWVVKVSGVSGLNVTTLDGIPIGAANGAVVETAHGLVITDQALNGSVRNISFPVCPIGLELLNTAAPAESHETTYSNIRFDAYYMCGIFRDVDVATAHFSNIVGFGHAGGGRGYLGYYGEGRSPGIYPTGGNEHTDVNFELAEVGWKLMGCQLDDFLNCVGDTCSFYGWLMDQGCQKLRLNNMWAATIDGTGGIGIRIQGSCLGIFLGSNLYTRFNTTADLSIASSCQVYLDDTTWGESQVTAGGGTYNQTFPSHFGGGPGKESLRVNNAGLNQVNRIEVQGNVAGSGVIFNATGADTNIDTFYLTKGTGGFFWQEFAAGVGTNIFAVDQSFTYHYRPPADLTTNYTVATNGGNVTIPILSSGTILDPAGAIAAFTVTLPAAPSDGLRIRLSSTQTITAFTLSPNTGQSIKNAITTFPAGSAVEYQYRLADTTWYRRL